MTRDDILAAIRATLADPLDIPKLAAFSPEARLNADLHLDSIQTLQLFLHLELRHGLAAPEEAIAGAEIERVSDLVDLFARDVEAAPAAAEPVDAGEGVHGEEYYDIKVHCFVSCVCAALKARGIDHRAFYFGVWDADFAVTDRWALRYHDPAVNHEAFRSWFRALYGVAMAEWYDHSRPKEDNAATLLRLVAGRRPGQSVMAMVDLHHLPERENKFNQNPFPHYLMLESAKDPAMFMVRDPDFRWEGEIAREAMLNAFSQPSVAGGYLFDGDAAQPASDTAVRDYFEACHRPDNPLQRSVRAIVEAHLSARDGLTLAELPLAIRQLPVIAIRKYAYEHGFAFFWRALKAPHDEFERWCDEIDALFKGLKTLHFTALKLAETGDRRLAADVFAEVERLDQLETRIKARLLEAFEEWRLARGLPGLAPEARRASA
ncbi:DUF6005 family protein [Chenggangzhangella methanolivorans]|uniref:DUF6005 family protein n=1 Tax=Chenggangzhangella methanolivorans TaxID=1437009 RepID=A0A9E6R7K1_9HYPH|nr:DUF6005 family protein [Chenggangzhangella methanolivorans]QZN98739.1 DUF6005 family protein [Chenggangzhangella methanolivorans]